MEAGSLRNRVVIQSKSATQDAFGGETITWSTHATRWASIEPLTGREYLEARQEQAEINLRIRLRYLSTAQPEWRVTWDSRTFEIVSVIHTDERDRETVLMCREAQ